MNLDPQSVAAFVFRARKRLDMTQDQLSELLDVTKAAVSGWENGRYEPDYQKLLQLSRQSGEPLPGTKKIPVSIESDVEDAPTLPSFVAVPVVGTVQGGDDGYLVEYEYPAGHGDGFVMHFSRDPGAYALRVRGDSMRPRIKSGEFVVVEPNYPVAPGDSVVVILKDGRRMVKELMYQRDDEISLGSVNDGYAPITANKAEVEAMHYVAAIIPRGAFHENK